MSNSIVNREEIPFGTIINNRYLIQRILGQGGLGRTYLAFDTHRFNEPCVLKEFAPFGSGQYDLEKSRDLFKREAKILHQISHPQIPKFLACFEGKGRLFLVQEYVNGKTYSALLQQRQQHGSVFTEPELIIWLMNLLPILKYIHQRGIIHRDISPDNIMQPDGEKLPVLIDFGVGKLTNAAYHQEDGTISPNPVNHSFVGKMSFVGKIGYAPREQISMGRCSASSDIYSLGVTALVLLTGREPTMLIDQYSLEWKWPEYTQVSQPFANILEKMTADRPSRRYQTTEEVLEQLQSLRRDGAKPAWSSSSPISKGIRSTVDEPEEDTIIVRPSSSNTSSPQPTTSSPNLYPSQSIDDTELVGNHPHSVAPASPPASDSTSYLAEETMIVNSYSLSHSGSQQQTPPTQSANFANTDIQRSKQPRVDPRFVKRCQKQLAYCIGPMANLIVDEIMLQYQPKSSQELVEALAEQIPDEQQAIQFRRNLLT